jgi:hypothetical protein
MEEHGYKSTIKTMAEDLRRIHKEKKYFKDSISDKVRG